MNPDYLVLLDVQFEGMKNFLRDFGWNVDTVTKLLGVSKEKRNDDKVIEYGKNHKNCIIVTQDQNLMKRCDVLNLKYVGVEMGDLAKIVNQSLEEKY